MESSNSTSRPPSTDPMSVNSLYDTLSTIDYYPNPKVSDVIRMLFKLVDCLKSIEKRISMLEDAMEDLEDIDEEMEEEYFENK